MTTSQFACSTLQYTHVLLKITLAYLWHTFHNIKKINYTEITAFWDVMLCGQVGMNGHFRQTWGNGYLYNTDTSVLHAYDKKAKSITSRLEGWWHTHTHTHTHIIMLLNTLSVSQTSFFVISFLQFNYTDVFWTKFLLSCLSVSYIFSW